MLDFYFQKLHRSSLEFHSQERILSSLDGSLLGTEDVIVSWLAEVISNVVSGILYIQVSL